MSRLLELPATRRKRVADAFASPRGRLIFVCHGNIMRSAFAVAWLHRNAPEHAARVVGAGTYAKEGREAEATAARVAAAMNVSLASHRATPYMMRGPTVSDIVVCMDRANEAMVLVASPELRSQVFLVGDISDGAREVLDPYGLGDAVTQAAFDRIARLATRWLELLLESNQ